ncbi:GNAT family N-acetyltransferase [Olleya sp. UBA1516]|uniref:GNAT family N-acetyltransferase n=1 Tax=Olleya sp. UBA1516 TaxID=1947013 RepID=UPI0025CC3496|nr:GNAT family N-acetyltransferase [Olleya sp. UBA1516]|tara:strand:- start:30358 stop:30870 length:513 start_codon:yes stop_codon:yes gene_type:complete
MVVAETERLIITKFTLDDAQFFIDLVNTPKFKLFIGDRKVNTIDQAKARIKKGHLNDYKTHGYGFYKLHLKAENNKPIGTNGLTKRANLELPDIGFAMLPEYEGKGYGLESSLAILELAKNSFDLKKIGAITKDNNVASIKLIEKLGFNFIKMVKPFEDDSELMLFAKNL